MSYATAADMLQYGASRLAQLAWPDQSGQADGFLLIAVIENGDTQDWTPEQIAAAESAVERIEQEIENGATMIDASLSVNHTLPLSGTPDLLKLWNLDIALYRLHRGELPDSDPVVQRYRDAQAGLKKIEQGSIRFEHTQTTSAASYQFTSNPALFQRPE